MTPQFVKPNTSKKSRGIGLNMAGESCSCDVAGWCERRQVSVPAIHFAKCKAGKVEHIDRVYEGLRAPKSNARPRVSGPARATVPDVSDLGTRLIAAIESAGNYKMRCDTCKRYLRSLNKSTHHHVDKILDGLLLHGELPQSVRDRVGGIKAQREWLRVIVEKVIME